MIFVLDEKDKFILKQLRANARMPFLEIAKKLGCSEGLVRKRVKQLTEAGIIKGFTANLDLKAPIEAIICIKAEAKKTKEVLDALAKFSEKVFPVFEVTGRFDIVCMAHANEARELNKAIDVVRGTSHVLSTETFTITNRIG